MNVFEAGKEFERELRATLVNEYRTKPMQEIVRLETSLKDKEVRVVPLAKADTLYYKLVVAVAGRMVPRCPGVKFTGPWDNEEPAP